MQERRDLGLEGFRTEGIQDWRDTENAIKKGSGHEGYGPGRMLDRRDTVKVGCRPDRMQDGRTAGLKGSGQEGCGTGEMLDRRDTGHDRRDTGQKGNKK